MVIGTQHKTINLLCREEGKPSVKITYNEFSTHSSSMEIFSETFIHSEGKPELIGSLTQSRSLILVGMG